MANVLASVAQYETEVRGERTAAGRKAREEKIKAALIIPKKPGRKPGSWQKVSPTIGATILQMRREGKAIAHIARELNLSRPTVYAVLKGE